MEQSKSSPPQNKPAPPFDRALVRARRTRAAKARPSELPFLYERAAQDCAERLFDVNRIFERVLICGNADLAARIIELAGPKISFAIIADHTQDIRGISAVCDEEALPFAPQSFDLVISALTLQGVNAVQTAMRRFREILKPDGLFIGALFGGGTLSELRRALYAAEDAVYGRISPRISPMIDVQQAAQILQGAGFAMPVTDKDSVKVRYKHLGSLFADLRAMGETNALTQRAGLPVSRRFFKALETAYQADHGDAQGRFLAGFDMIYLTGWAPHRDQPKPIKPGSAKARLSDALGVKETKL